MDKTIDLGLPAVQGASREMDKTLENTCTAVADLSKELLVLRLAFGKLKATVADAAAPFGAVLVPMLSKAVFWAIRVVKYMGQVAAAFFGVQTVTRSISKAADTASKAAKRTVAGFDQLTRLNGSSAGGSAVKERSFSVSPEAVAAAEKLRAILAPLAAIDLTPLRWSLARLGEVLAVLGQQVAAGVGFVWQAVLTPFAAWVAEKCAPVFLNALRGALTAVSTALTPLGEGFSHLWQALKPITDFVGQTALTVFDHFRRLFGELSSVLTEKSTQISAVFQNVAEVITALWAAVSPVLTGLRTQWALSFQNISEITGQVMGFVVDCLHGVTQFLAGAFTGDWEQAWKCVGQTLKACVNGVIGILNLLLSGITGALNGVITLVNKLRFTVPDWVPGLGGQEFGFSLKTLTAPKIPYLAQGAVLPANKPFLAVVGDQRHGTNIEAPLATIEQAVSGVMQQQTGAILAGFEASVGVQKEILQAVLGISIGDDVIGAAAQRYLRRQAVMQGGSVC